MNQTVSDYRFKFSVVTAVYNVEPYLEEAIESIVAQDIGFEKSVEMILVDDGSTDGSGAICDKYQQRFPNNIKVIHKENGGVSSARNEGFRHTSGRFVSLTLFLYQSTILKNVIPDISSIISMIQNPLRLSI